MRAQDQALLWLARLWGCFTPEQEGRLQAADRPGGPLVAALVRDGLLSPDRATALLRELAGTRFACAGCARVVGYEALAPLEALACPECRRPLTPFGAPRPSGPASAVLRRTGPLSGTSTPVRGVPVPGQPPSGSFPAVRPHPSSGRFQQIVLAQALQDPGREVRAEERTMRVEAVPPAVRRLGPYLLERELGRGANGVVWLARREGLERTYAVKVLTRAAAQDATTFERFKVEARLASRLDHPGIVSVIDAGSEGDEHYYVMTYCPGRTLQERLREGAIAPADAIPLLVELARTMAFAHKLQVLHRDLKPANVILAEVDGRPRITDFGLARDLARPTQLTQSGDLLGTPYYMAPERFRGEGQDDPRVDVYALGVIAYEVLTGRRPFDAQTPAELADRIEGSTPLAPHLANPSVPAAVGAICLRAMARDPAARHPTADAVADELQAFLRTLGAAARASTPSSSSGDSASSADDAPVAPPITRTPAELAALGLLVTGVSLCVLVLAWAILR